MIPRWNCKGQKIYFEDLSVRYQFNVAKKMGYKDPRDMEKECKMYLNFTVCKKEIKKENDKDNN
mgnify:FL=1|jgi:hypothetical protein